MMSNQPEPMAKVNREIIGNVVNSDLHLANAAVCRAKAEELRKLLWDVIGDPSQGMSVNEDTALRLAVAIIDNAEIMRGGLLSIDMLLTLAGGNVGWLQNTYQLAESSNKVLREDNSALRSENLNLRQQLRTAETQRKQSEATIQILRADMEKAQETIATKTASVRKLQRETRQLRKQVEVPQTTNPVSQQQVHREVEVVLL